MRKIDQPILLDESMGRELRARGVDIPHTIWSANALLVAPDEEIRPLYREQASLIVPYVDMMICETMSCAREALAAAMAACETIEDDAIGVRVDLGEAQYARQPQRSGRGREGLR
ncbi:MAG: homocysteine S-methyltransferase family protein [Pseudomonadales bacterium]